jgi:hypothetical protein
MSCVAGRALQVLAAEMEARFKAEQEATRAAQAQRVQKREKASVAAAAQLEAASLRKREAHASVEAWQRGRTLPALLSDLPVKADTKSTLTRGLKKGTRHFFPFSSRVCLNRPCARPRRGCFSRTHAFPRLAVRLRRRRT